MAHHCDTSDVIIGEYWRGYTQKTFIEVDLFGEDIFSDKFFFATTFGAGSLRSKPSAHKGLFEKYVDPLLWKAFSPKMPSAIRNSFLSNVLFPRLTGRLARRNKDGLGYKFFDFFVNCYYALLKDEINRYGLETVSQASTNDVDIEEENGKNFLFSYVTLRHFANFLRIVSMVDCRGKVVLEIGSGIGELARIFMTTNVSKKYILCDIPPALAFAEKHILENMDASRVSLFDPNRTGVDLDSDHDLFFITPDQLTLVPHFDVGVNIYSFGEMTLDIVTSYVKKLKGIGFSDFVTINQRIGKSGNTDYFGEKEYREIFSPEFHAKSLHSVGGRGLPLIFDDLPGVDGYQAIYFTNNSLSTDKESPAQN